MEENKKTIIDNFKANVKGKKYDATGFNLRHDGAEGHWLEMKMGIARTEIMNQTYLVMR
jgi:hypothetical protein